MAGMLGEKDKSLYTVLREEPPNFQIVNRTMIVPKIRSVLPPRGF
jgi:hypothetical protein